MILVLSSLFWDDANNRRTTISEQPLVTPEIFDQSQTSCYRRGAN